MDKEQQARTKISTVHTGSEEMVRPGLVRELVGNMQAAVSCAPQTAPVGRRYWALPAHATWLGTVPLFAFAAARVEVGQLPSVCGFHIQA